MRHRVSSGDWYAALQPDLWQTVTALVLGVLYAMLAEGTAATAARNVVPVTERAQVALLTAPVSGICAIAVAVTHRGDKAVVAAAIADTIALAGVTAITARAAAARFAVVSAVTGYLAAGAVQLRALTGARTGPAVHAALVTAAGHWALVTAAITGAVALALACTPGRGEETRPGGRPDDTPGRAPVPGAGGTLDHG